MITEPASTVRPYKGRHSFGDTDNDRLLFFGREDEARMLINVVAAERLSVLYARSGLGKTSLINARLLEGLRESGYFPAVVRLTQDKEGDPLRSLFLGLESEAKRQDVAIAAENRDSLWEYFLDARFTRNGKPLRPVLVLDQFEELFTLVRERSEQHFANFVEQLADLVRGRMPAKIREAALKRLEKTAETDPEHKLLSERVYEDAAPDIKVLLSFREDFLAEMEALQDRIPGIFRNVVRMRPLNRKNAEAAIARPCQAKEVLGDNNTFTFDPAAVKQMLDFLGTQLKGKREITGEEIEPVHLQLLCDELDRQRRSKGDGKNRLISVDDLGGINGMTRILERYYQSVLQRFPRVHLGWSARAWRPSTTNLIIIHFPRTAIRKLCENGLITPSRRRNIMMAEDVKRNFGIDDAILASLVNERLLRCEPRLGSEFYELAHDSLVAPLASARLRRRIWLAAFIFAFVVVPYAVLVLNAVMTVRSIKAVEQRREVEISKRDADRKEDLATLSRKDASTEERNRAFRRLVRQETDLTNQQFSFLSLEGERIGDVDFSGSNLQRVTFDRASFGKVSFERADLSGASFAGAKFENVTFERANLNGANLRGVNFTGDSFVNADLRAAVLAETDLTGARMNGALVDAADFTATEWWFASGWSPEQIQNLKKRWPNQSITSTGRYRDAIKNRRATVDEARDDDDRARALNDLAWYRAVRGVDLESALKEASEAVSIRSRLPNKPNLSNALDTLGYIQLQLGKHQEALAAFRRIDWAGQRSEERYHFSLVLSATGNHAEARKLRDESAKRYQPTYELLLTPAGSLPER